MKEDGGKPSDQKEIVVFSILKPGTCSECQAQLGPGNLLRMEGERPFCMDCADLGHLVLLPSGNAAVTLRSRKYSSLWAVVVRFSRARGRYERQGLLVEPAALERAETECMTDEEARRLRRERAAVYREKIDAKYVEEFARHVHRSFPGCPPDEATSIALHACEKYTGRIGRSASAKSLDPAAVDLAVRAHVRHVHTPYDKLLARGLDRDVARGEIAGAVAQVMERWRRGSSNEEALPDQASPPDDR
jgi:hypothetical protein